MSAEIGRVAGIRAGVRIELMSVIWMVIETGVAVVGGLAAGSALLLAFGLDSMIELVSGSVLLWRLRTEERGQDAERVERMERIATWVVAVSLILLCIYVLATALYGIIVRVHPQASPVGIAVSVAAVVAMPYLGLRKRAIAAAIGSAALRGDAAESFTCGFMAATVLVGLALDAAAGWYWAEDLAALAFLFWLGREAWEAIEDARDEES